MSFKKLLPEIFIIFLYRECHLEFSNYFLPIELNVCGGKSRSELRITLTESLPELLGVSLIQESLYSFRSVTVVNNQNISFFRHNIFLMSRIHAMLLEPIQLRQFCVQFSRSVSVEFDEYTTIGG